MKAKKRLLIKISPVKFWLTILCAGLVFIYGWNALFLYEAGFSRWQAALFNSLLVSLFASFLAICLGWAASFSKYMADYNSSSKLVYTLNFIFDLIKSIPQIIGALVGYIFLTELTARSVVVSSFTILSLMSIILSFLLFLEAYDMFNSRIEYYKNKDFIAALRTLGMSESRIINEEIFLKNSKPYIIQKYASIFGSIFFLQASVDFIISVGLTLKTNLVSLPPTLGNLLARIDSKQDIFALGYAITNPSYFFELPFKHLQGLSAAFTLVFILICVYKLANALAERLDK